jgi:hypothetical protein
MDDCVITQDARLKLAAIREPAVLDSQKVALMAWRLLRKTPCAQHANPRSVANDESVQITRLFASMVGSH